MQPSKEKVTVSVYIDKGLADFAKNLPQSASVSKLTEEALKLVGCRQSWRLTGDILMGMVIISLGMLFIGLLGLLVVVEASNVLAELSLFSMAVIMISLGMWVVCRDLAVTAGLGRVVKEASNGHS